MVMCHFARTLRFVLEFSDPEHDVAESDFRYFKFLFLMTLRYIMNIVRKYSLFVLH